MAAISGKFHRTVLSRARAACLAVGADCELVPQGRHKHAKLVITYRGRTRSTPVSGTPSIDAADAVAMKLADIRRVLREIVQ